MSESAISQANIRMMCSVLPLLVFCLIITTSLSAPITPSPPLSTPTDKEGMIKSSNLTFSDLQDVMMDPSARMRKFAK